MTAIEGRVAAVMNIREVAINRGSEHGVKSGMTFAILAESPLEITDPETGAVLTSLDREKVRVRVTEVGKNYSIASTFKVFRTGGIDLSALTLGESLFGQPKERIQTLTVEDSELPRPLPESQSYVKRGDRVREVVEAKTE